MGERDAAGSLPSGPDVVATHFWDLSIDMLAMANLDGYLTHVNPAWGPVLGYSVQELTSQPYINLVHPDDVDATFDEAGRLLGSGETVDFQNRYLAKDGTYRWLQWRSCLSEDGRSIYCVVRDVTALADRDARLQAIFDSAAIGMATADFEGILTSVNQAFADIAGRGRQELVGMSFTELTHPDDRNLDRENLAEFGSDTFTHKSYQKRYLRPDGAVVWVHVYINVHLNNGVPVGLSAQVQDVTDLRAARAHLEYLANHDQLTGLNNRNEFANRLARILAGRRQHGNATALLFCDLDGFEQVNDIHGHAVGDAVLKEVARRIGACVRSDDLVARFGGDEFVAVLAEIRDADSAVEKANQICAAVRAPICLDEANLTTTISIGVALASPGKDSARLLADADAALYQAKAAGRDRVVISGSANDLEATAEALL